MNKLITILYLISTILIFSQNEWKVSTVAEWNGITKVADSVKVMGTLDIGGEFDVTGDGAIMLSKGVADSLFALTNNFAGTGYWESEWKTFNSLQNFSSLQIDLLTYGKPIDMTKGWRKFDKNPVFAGENTLLPLNPDNITEETILLPDSPGGVPQDQSIIKGKGVYEGKWVMFFNHTPDAWPNNYYWSIAVADSLAPLKRGKNPFYIPEDHYPLFGPIDNQAPNDWIEINGRYYAPDETYQSMAHLWISDDMFNWTDLGAIENKLGSDPGIVFDGTQFHLFNENGNSLAHCLLDIDSVRGSNNQVILDVGDHTGDADVSFFNNQWHMYMDDGAHLHYKISYAVTTPDSFPYGWQLYPEIYGPHNPEQGQVWDDDNELGNRFGTGDADIALEGNTLYMFTERPIGAAYKELNELLDGTGQKLEVMIETDSDNDGIADDSTDWKTIQPGESIWNFESELEGTSFKIKYRFSTDKLTESPMIKQFILSDATSSPSKIDLEANKFSLFTLEDSVVNINIRVVDDIGRLCSDFNEEVLLNIEGPGFISGSDFINVSAGTGEAELVAKNESGIIKVWATSGGLVTDTIKISTKNHIVLDNFDNYSNQSHLSGNWGAIAGLNASISLDSSDYFSGEASLSLSYGIGNGNPPYSGIATGFNYTNEVFANLGFNLKGDGSDRELVIRLSESSAVYWQYSLFLSSTEWSEYDISFEEFEPNYAATGLDISKINNIAFYILPGNGGLGDGIINIDEIVILPEGITAVIDEQAITPEEFILYPNYPNPFNPSTTISFSNPLKQEISIDIYNVLGERIKTIKNIFDSGIIRQKISFNNLPSGIYVCNVAAGKLMKSVKLVLLK